jgi:glycosyltransferase involved in cell wall biosynthesis
MRVSLISGILIEKDAISAATRAKAKALEELFREAHIPLDLRIYVIASDFDLGGRVRVVENVSEVVLDRHFTQSELIIYDFGIHNDLFNSIHLAPAEARKMVHFHNITPPELMPESMRGILNESLEQRVNLFKADTVLSGSRFNEETLLDYGIDEAKIAYINYVVDLPHAAGDHPSVINGAAGALQALYVGRFTRPKGVIDLLKAVQLAADGGAENIRLTLVGNQQLSSDEYIDELRSYIDEHDLADRVELITDATDEELLELYERSHLLLIASYHEGFCIPVIEALHRGSYIIAYDAGNLPHVVNGLGNIVPTGDVGALGEAIIAYSTAVAAAATPEEAVLPANAGPMGEPEFTRRALEYSLDFSYEKFRDRLAGILRDSALLP